jgi:hypothetical protein
MATTTNGHRLRAAHAADVMDSPKIALFSIRAEAAHVEAVAGALRAMDDGLWDMGDIDEDMLRSILLQDLVERSRQVTRGVGRLLGWPGCGTRPADAE